jgi:hypothetical protein
MGETEEETFSEACSIKLPFIIIYLGQFGIACSPGEK